jgi:uncharacterized membrane protein
MFCNACGKEVVTGSTACPACGQPQPITMVATPAASRISQHGRLLGMLWVAYSLLVALVGCVLLIVANTVIVHVQTQGAPPFLHPLLSMIAIVIFAKAALDFAAGFGLLQRAGWGRMMALIMGFLSLFNMPFGTALGIYTLYVLLATNGERDYEHYVNQAP